MPLQPTDIERMVIDIQASTVKNKETFFATQYAALKQSYPYLYNAACTTTLNMATLKFMLNMMSKVEDKTTTTHDASVEVGQRLYNEFVEPNLDKK